MFSDLIETAVKAVARFVVDIVFLYTGETILLVATAGRRKPRWDGYTNDPPAPFVVRSELSIYIGGATWIFGIGMVARWLLAWAAILTRRCSRRGPRSRTTNGRLRSAARAADRQR